MTPESSMLIVRPLPHQTQGEDISVCWREVQVDPGGHCREMGVSGGMTGHVC